jgi:PIN domain nuclease of toxin-antitoxin system
MKLLLDTHILLWSLIDPSQLSRRVADELESPSNELWLSPISTWEIVLLSEKGRVVLDAEPATWLRSVFERIPFKEAVLNHEIAIQSRLLDLPHQAPADRFLAATAIVYDLTLVTSDKRLMTSRNFSVLSNEQVGSP